LKKQKKFNGNKFESDTIYNAHKFFLTKSGIPEKDFLNTFRIEKNDIVTEFDNSVEFFANFSHDKEYRFAAFNGDIRFSVSNYGNRSYVEVQLPNESDIDTIFGMFDGTITATSDMNKNVEINVENSFKKFSIQNKKLWYIGIGISISLFVLGYFLTKIPTLP